LSSGDETRESLIKIPPLAEGEKTSNEAIVRKHTVLAMYTKAK